MDNIELIKYLLIQDERMVKAIIEMVKKHQEQEYGYLMLNYEHGKITCIKSERSIK